MQDQQDGAPKRYVAATVQLQAFCTAYHHSKLVHFLERHAYEVLCADAGSSIDPVWASGRTLFDLDAQAGAEAHVRALPLGYALARHLDTTARRLSVCLALGLRLVWLWVGIIWKLDGSGSPQPHCIHGRR